jgi:phage tail sheath protein FI
MDYKHGVYVTQEKKADPASAEGTSGIAFAVGTAPVHTVTDGSIQDPVLCRTYAEAVKSFGYSDDWTKYSLCELMYSHFKLYNASPVILVNVLDPAVNRTAVEEDSYGVADNKVILPFEAISSEALAVRSADGNATYIKGTDYDVYYDEDKCVVEIIDGGTVPAGAAELRIAFDALDFTGIDRDDIIGGFSPATHKSGGLELIDGCFPKFAVVPDLIVCPGYSHDPEVAAAMAAKAARINGVFTETCKALIDADTAAAPYYTDVAAWKSLQGISSKEQILFYPMLKLGGRVFHASVQAAGLIAQVDKANDNTPAESPSNKSLQADAAVTADGTEVRLSIAQANFLGGNGIVTAINFIGGFRLWGNFTACYPENTDARDCLIPVSRMFGWVGKSLILSYWSRLDGKLTRRFVDSVLDSINIWLNGLVSEEKLLGGRVEFLADENRDADFMQGIIRFHLFVTPPSPAQEIDCTLEYDVSYLETLFA